MGRFFKSADTWQTREGAAFWMKDVETYGANDYVKGLLAMIAERNPRTVFEVGLCTGYPFASSLLEKNVDVHGCDVSDFLLQTLRERYPRIRWHHCGYEDMVAAANGQQYDAVYCFRSSWYFTDLFKAIDNMLALARPGGAVLFDIMNSQSPAIRAFVRATRMKKYRALVKNAVKWALNPFVKKKFVYYDVNQISSSHPVSPEAVDAFLDGKNATYQKYTFEQVSGAAAHFDQDNFRIVYRVSV